MAVVTAVVDGMPWNHGMKVSTEILIPASRGKVWAALVDFPRYRRWHPVVEIEGPATEGAEVDYFYRSGVNAPRGMSMKAKIKTLQPARELCMEFGVRGFATIEERYLLLREGTQVRVIHSASVRGVLPLLAGRFFRRRLTEKLQLPLDWLARHLTPKQGSKERRA